MSETRILVDPTNETKPAIRQRAARLESLEGRTIGLLDISKPRGDLFLDQIEKGLRSQGANVVRYKKHLGT